MATPVTHVRLLENLLNYGFQLDPSAFVLGCLAPYADTDDRRRTHYYNQNNCVQPEAFFEEQIADYELAAHRLAFLFGYYVHLVSDVEWYAQVIQPMSHDIDIRQQDQVALNLYQEVKPDQLLWDMSYLVANPDNLFEQVIRQDHRLGQNLASVTSVGLDQLLTSLRSTYLDDEQKRVVLQTEYRWIQPIDIDSYVECTTRVLIELLRSKGISCPNPRPLSAYGIRIAS